MNALWNLYDVQPTTLSHYYIDITSDFAKDKPINWWEWQFVDIAEKWWINSDNIGSVMCLDEKNIQKWEVFTILSNPEKDWIWAVIPWTKWSEISKKLMLEIPDIIREKVLEIVTDMSPSMESIVKIAFPNAILTTDRFHVMKMILDDLNAIRMRIKTLLKKKEGDTIKQAKLEKKKYVFERYSNGETEVEIVTRLKRQMCRRMTDRSNNQKQRWLIVQGINEFQELVTGYKFVCKLRDVYDNQINKEQAEIALNLWIKEWQKHVDTITEIDNMITSVENRLDSITNYFVRRTTNW